MTIRRTETSGQVRKTLLGNGPHFQLSSETQSQAASEATPPKVFVVDDDPAIRALLEAACGDARLHVRSYETAEAFLKDLRPDDRGCLILDYQLPGMTGVDLQQWLAQQGIVIPTILITAHGCTSVAVRAMQAGAMDVLDKPIAIAHLMERVRVAIELDERRARGAAQRGVYQKRLATLSPREYEVMLRLAANRSTKSIAAELGISAKTVGVHRARIMHKMDADGLVGLANIARHLGLIE